MELNELYKSFFALLTAGLWNREPECTYFPLSPEKWEQVYRFALKQTVEGIVFDGMLLLPEHFLPPKNLIIKWVVAVDAIEKKNIRMNKAIGELNNLFLKNGIRVLLTKGQGVAACYSNPLHRQCGDIDLAFPKKDMYDSANRLIQQRNKNVEKQAGFSSDYVWKEFIVEHHGFLLDISNPFLFRYLRRLQRQEEDQSMHLQIAGNKVQVPSPVLMHLSVNSHILRHLLSFGISIRQLCDSARLCYMYHNKPEMQSLEKIYRKLGIYQWIQMLNSLLVDYLGMSEEYLPFPVKTKRNADWMMKDILQGGSFGFFGGLFSKGTDTPQLKRKHTWLHLSVRFFRYVRYAPYEACWFPVMHTYSHFKNWISK